MSGRGWVLFGVMCVIWGVTYSLIKIVVEAGVSPLFMTWARVVLASGLLLTLAWRADLLRGLARYAVPLVGFAVVEMIVPQPLIAAGERDVSSSLTAIIIASSPLFVSLLALRFDSEEVPSRRALFGLFCGLVGVALLVGIHVTGSRAEAIGIAAILVSALLYAVGPLVVSRRLASVDPRASMGVTVAIAAVALTPAVPFTAPEATPPAKALIALAFLGFGCTGAAFLIYGALIVEVGARRALVVTYVNPVVALFIGVIFLDESAGPTTVAGLLLILVGSWLGTGGALPSVGEVTSVLLSRRRGDSLGA